MARGARISRESEGDEGACGGLVPNSGCSTSKHGRRDHNSPGKRGPPPDLKYSLLALFCIADMDSMSVFLAPSRAVFSISRNIFPRDGIETCRHCIAVVPRTLLRRAPGRRTPIAERLGIRLRCRYGGKPRAVTGGVRSLFELIAKSVLKNFLGSGLMCG